MLDRDRDRKDDIMAWTSTPLSASGWQSGKQAEPAPECVDPAASSYQAALSGLPPFARTERRQGRATAVSNPLQPQRRPVGVDGDLADRVVAVVRNDRADRIAAQIRS